MELLDEHRQAEVAYTLAADNLQELVRNGHLFDRFPSLSREDQQEVEGWMSIIVHSLRREASKSAELSERMQRRIARQMETSPE